MRRGGWARLVVVLAVAAIGAWGLTAISGPAAAASPGALSGFAGGLGFGRATNVAQVPLGLAARAGRLVSVEGTLSPPSVGPMPGLVRTLDLASGTQTVLAGL